jgi:hypothetical protein
MVSKSLQHHSSSSQCTAIRGLEQSTLLKVLKVGIILPVISSTCDELEINIDKDCYFSSLADPRTRRHGLVDSSEFRFKITVSVTFLSCIIE